MSGGLTPGAAAIALLEAADDLLSAAKALDAFWSEDGSSPEQELWTDEMRGVWLQIRAAVAKAEGRPS